MSKRKKDILWVQIENIAFKIFHVDLYFKPNHSNFPLENGCCPLSDREYISAFDRKFLFWLTFWNDLSHLFPNPFYHYNYLRCFCRKIDFQVSCQKCQKAIFFLLLLREVWYAAKFMNHWSKDCNYINTSKLNHCNISWVQSPVLPLCVTSGKGLKFCVPHLKKKFKQHTWQPCGRITSVNIKGF